MTNYELNQSLEMVNIIIKLAGGYIPEIYARNILESAVNSKKEIEADLTNKVNKDDLF